MNEIKHVILYDEPSTKTLDLKAIKTFVNQQLPSVKIVICKDFLSYYLKRKNFENFAKELAKARVKDINKPQIEYEPLFGEIECEKNALKKRELNTSGILYDGVKLMKLFQTSIPLQTLSLSYVHIIFTNRLFGTFDETDRRYHARVILCGLPSIISTAGIVEAPAKPREFYILKQRFQYQEHLLSALKEKFKGRYIDYDDERLTEVMKGYVMQAIFYALIFDPFCPNKHCRLYNAHWQEEVINAQLKSGKCCKRHEKILEEYRKKNISNDEAMS